MASGCRMKEFALHWRKSAWRLLRILSCVTLCELLLPSSLPHSHLDSSEFAINQKSFPFNICSLNPLFSPSVPSPSKVLYLSITLTFPLAPSVHSSIHPLPLLLILYLLHLPPFMLPSLPRSIPTLSPARSLSQLPPPASSSQLTPAEGRKGPPRRREQSNRLQEWRRLMRNKRGIMGKAQGLAFLPRNSVIAFLYIYPSCFYLVPFPSIFLLESLQQQHVQTPLLIKS